MRHRCQSLTDREREILALIADGLTYYAVARRLELTQTAVSHYMTRIFRKLGAINAPNAVALAMRGGMLK